MSDAATTLLQQALALPEEDRRWLVEQIDGSLWSGTTADEEREFYAEIARRSDEAHAHPERLIPWDVARENIRVELERRRAARERGETP